MDAVEEALGGRGRAAGDVERFVHGMTVGHERAARGKGGAHRAARHRGLHRPRGARPPGARRAVPALRGPPAAARAGASCAWRCPSATGPDGVLRAARRGRAARARSTGSTPRPPRSACCGASAIPSTSGAWPSCSRRRCRDPRLDLARDRRRVPRVRALRDDGRRRRAVAAAARLPRAADRARAREAGLPEPEVMLSSGGTRRARASRRGTAPGPCCRARPAAPWARRAARERRGDAVGLDMGGTSCDVSLIVGGARGASGSGREVGGRALALPMVDVHTVGAGRRLDRLARRRRRPARGAALGGRRPGARLLRARRRASRRSPTPTCCSATSTRTRRSPAACGSTATPPSARWPARRTSSGLELDETAAGIVARGERRDGAGGAGGDGRARHRPARARARRRSAAPGPLHAAADRRRARHAAGARAGGERRAVGARPGGLRAAPRPGRERAARRRRADARSAIAAVGRAARRSAAARSSERGPSEPSCAPPTTCATRARPSSCRSRASRARPGRAAARVRPRPRGALRLRGPGRRARAGDRAGGGGAAGRGAAAGRAGTGLPGDALDGAGRGRACPARRSWCPQGWRARRTRRTTLVVMRAAERRPLDPVTLQVMLGSLRAACDEMGAVLVRSAHSANIKERRDASTALFDADGPDGHAGRAHPGAPRRDAVARSRRCSARSSARASPGSSTTPTAAAPTCPDITRDHAALPRRRAGRASPRAAPTTPTWAPQEPGSMPARLAHARRRGRRDPAHAPDRRACCASSPGRMRNPRQREADLRAQLAAGRAGAERVAALIERFGIDTVRAGMRETLDYAERRTRARIAELEDGAREAARRARGRRDGDLELRLRARRSRATSWSSTSPARPTQHDGNLNCPLAVTLSACYFALRVLTDPDVPPCAGAYRPLTVTRARGLAAERAPARGGGGRQRGDLLARGGPRAGAPSGTRSARAR